MARGLTIANQRALKVSGRSIVRSAIPDSGGDHQCNYTTGSGTTIEDVIGDVDAEYIDLSWSSNAGAGENHDVLDGGDNIADLGSSIKSDWLHFITDQKGILFSWIKPDTIFDRQYLISAGYDGGQSNRSISFRLNGNSIEINVFDGEGNKLYEHSGGSIETSDWTAVAMVADGEVSKLFIAKK